MHPLSLLGLVSLCFPPSALAAQYFVQLKAPSTFEALLKSDDTVKAIHHLRPLVQRAVSFGSFEGFTGSFDSDVLSRLRKNPLVEEVTLDIVVRTCNETSSHDQYKVQDGAYDTQYEVQHNAPRHLARLSRRSSLDEADDENESDDDDDDDDGGSLDYYYPSQFQGQGVNAYVIDTGVQCDHPEFDSRCLYGADFTGEGPGDRNGHGTHVAGIIGSSTYGVAKQINIVAVKALDRSGTGSLSSIISGIEFAVNHMRTASTAAANGGSTRGLINLSIGAFRNSVLNKAIEEAFNAGLVLVAAAGNSNMDACATSPASARHAITVGAIDDRTDSLAGFSNWGRCVNVLASGVRVASVNSHGKSPLLLSGTSMATPSVAGIAGLMLSAGVSPEDVKRRIKQTSTVGAVSRLSLLLRPVTPNRLAYVDYQGDFGDGD